MNGLVEKARAGVLWNAGFGFVRDLLQFATTVVLVRLLTPEEYGQFGLVIAILGYLNVFSFRSFLSHVLQLRRDDEVDYHLHFTTGVALNSALFAVTNLLAVGLRSFETYAPVAPFVHVVSVAFLLDCFSELRVTMLERALDWRRLRAIHTVGLVGNSLLSIALALAGAGVYALIVPPLVVRLPFIVDLLAVEGWRPALTWSTRRFGPAWRFGRARLVSGATVTGRQLLQSTVLVQLAGYAAFGVLGRALGIAQLLVLRFPLIFLQSIYPALTRGSADPARRRRAAAVVLQGVAWLVIPAGVAVATLARPLVTIVYGDRWMEAVPLLPWAAGGAVFASLAQTVYSLLLADDGQDRCLLSDLWVFLGTAVSLWLLAPRGLAPFLQGMIAVQAVAFLLLLRWLHGRERIALRAVATALLPAACTTALAVAACASAAHAFAPSALARVVLLGPVFGLLYLLLLRLLFSGPLETLVGYVPGSRLARRALLLRGGGPAGAPPTPLTEPPPAARLGSRE